MRWLIAGLIGVAALGAVVWAVVAMQKPQPGVTTTDASIAKNAPVVCIGYVQPKDGIVPLSSMQPSRITEVLVKEGDKVVKDQVLLSLDDMLARQAVYEARSQVASARLRLEQADHDGEKLELQRKAGGANLHALTAQIDAAERTIVVKREMQTRQLASASEVALAEAKVVELRAMRDAEQARLDQTNLTDPTLNKRLIQQDIERAEEAQKLTELQLKKCCVVAPTDGHILRILCGTGSIIGPSQPAVQFACSNQLVVRVELEQLLADKIVVGMNAVIEPEPAREAKWKGHVSLISNWYSRPRSSADENRMFNDVLTLECYVAIDDPTDLRVGERVRVSIQPGSTQPASTQPASTQPGSTQPGSTQPASTQPGSTQPASTQPGSTQPGSTQ